MLWPSGPVKQIRCIEVLRGDLGEAMTKHDTAHRSGSGPSTALPGNARPAPVQGLQCPPPLGKVQVGLADEGHLMLVLPPGEVVTGSMAAEAAEEIDRLASLHSLPMLLTLSGVESISRSARDVFSAARSLAAVAVIGISPVDRVIANFLLGGEVQPCPTRYFSSEAAAIKWLKRYAA